MVGGLWSEKGTKMGPNLMNFDEKVPKRDLVFHPVAADGHQQEVAHIFEIFKKVQKMKLLEPKN